MSDLTVVTADVVVGKFQKAIELAAAKLEAMMPYVSFFDAGVVVGEGLRNIIALESSVNGNFVLSSRAIFRVIGVNKFYKNAIDETPTPLMSHAILAAFEALLGDRGCIEKHTLVVNREGPDSKALGDAWFDAFGAFFEYLEQQESFVVSEDMVTRALTMVIGKAVRESRSAAVMAFFCCSRPNQCQSRDFLRGMMCGADVALADEDASAGAA